MRQHLDLLIALHRLWGAFGIIVAASLAILAIGTELALTGTPLDGRPERGTVAVLLVCAVMLAIGAAGALIIGRSLHGRSQAGRAAALLLAVPNLIVVPFGTGLGVYTFWVLLNNDARREFGRPPRGPAS